MSLDRQGERSLIDLLRERIEAQGAAAFLVFEDREGRVEELTYAAFGERVRACAGGLGACGVEPGTRVVVHLANSPEFLVSWFALMWLGAVMVPSNVANTASELRHMFDHTEARAAITEPRLAAAVREAAPAGTTMVIARGQATPPEIAFADLPALATAPPPAPRARGIDLAELLFTSGTTKKPKAVMLTHSNCLRAGLDTVHSLWLQEGERCLTALPLFHVNGQGMTVLAAMTVGGTAILIEEFSASRFWEQIRRHRATQTAIVAMQLRTLLAQPPAPTDREHALRRVFYAINVADGEKEEFERRYGVSLINGYGCSEAMTLLTVAPVAAPRRWPSVGLPAPGRRLKLIDDDGNEVAQGEVGEVIVHGEPGRSLMLGYERDPEATAAVMRGEWFHTGDSAYADEQGYLYFFDRKKDMIKRAGENVSASEVEAVIADHPAVAEAAVVGVPDPIRDEAVAAVVVLKPGGTLTAAEVTEHCRAQLSRFKVPTVVRFEDGLPKTSIGKVRKDVLRKRLS